MPTDDEDLLYYQGSSSGDLEGEEREDIAVVEEGSGSAVYHQSLSPTEIGELRTSFYEANEVDLLRLDTTCQDRFISAPQIFHAKISGYDHQVPNPAQPGYFYSLAKYKCDEGYESPILRMFCSDGEWMGKQPQCTKLE